MICPIARNCQKDMDEAVVRGEDRLLGSVEKKEYNVE